MKQANKAILSFDDLIEMERFARDNLGMQDLLEKAKMFYELSKPPVPVNEVDDKDEFDDTEEYICFDEEDDRDF